MYRELLHACFLFSTPDEVEKSMSENSSFVLECAAISNVETVATDGTTGTVSADETIFLGASEPSTSLATTDDKKFLIVTPNGTGIDR